LVAKGDPEGLSLVCGRVLCLRATLRDAAFDTIKNGLARHGLLAKPPPPVP
jgi:hypothetical protein